MTKKYSTAAAKKIGKVMDEFKKGKLKSSSGDKVNNRKQAIAIGISEAKQKGLKVPAKKKAAGKKTIAKKIAATKKKATAKKSTPVKKTVVAKRKIIPATKPVARKTQKPASKKNVADPTLVEKIMIPADNTTAIEQTGSNIPPVEENSPAIGPENSITIAPDLNKKNMQQAAVRNYDNHNLRLSNHSKGGIKPSGKKPLW